MKFVIFYKSCASNYNSHAFRTAVPNLSGLVDWRGTGEREWCCMNDKCMRLPLVQVELRARPSLAWPGSEWAVGQ